MDSVAHVQGRPISGRDDHHRTERPARLALGAGQVRGRAHVAGTKKPVLLRIEEQAGHGIGSTKSQTDGLFADTYSFVFWRAGRPGWAPAD